MYITSIIYTIYAQKYAIIVLTHCSQCVCSKLNTWLELTVIMKGIGFMGTVFAVVNLAEILNSPFGREGTSMNVTPGLWGYMW